jgi:molybdopterin molybdotransferase
MIKFVEALETILKHTNRLGKEKVCITQSLGRVLAEDIIADRDNPPSDNSGMDGFAVKYEDIKDASEESPAVLKIVGEAKAGGDIPEIKKGEASYIYTGGLIPKGADTIVQKELTKVEEDRVYIYKALKKGANIRKQGEDYKKGEILIKAGKKIRPAEMGIIASVNKPFVYVYQEPKVCILTTGDEILDIGEPITSLSQIRTSNTYSLYGQVLEAGGQPIIGGFVKDNPKDIEEKLQFAKNSDILITTGGVSMGKYDLIRDFVQKVLGVKIIFWKVAQKPGKPLVFGVWGENNEKLFFGIPGNPVASMVVFENFVKPVIRKMRGETKIFDPKIKAKLTKTYSRKKSERLEFFRVFVEYKNGEFLATPFGKQGSNILTGMVYANGLALIDIGKNEIKEGEEVEVIIFDKDFLNRDSFN